MNTIDDHAMRPVSATCISLSGGQRQLAALSIAIMQLYQAAAFVCPGLQQSQLQSTCTKMASFGIAQLSGIQSNQLATVRTRTSAE
jgi:hypothetical protein